jgi:hypothetical protein
MLDSALGWESLILCFGKEPFLRCTSFPFQTLFGFQGSKSGVRTHSSWSLTGQDLQCPGWKVSQFPLMSSVQTQVHVHRHNKHPLPEISIIGT